MIEKIAEGMMWLMMIMIAYMNVRHIIEISSLKTQMREMQELIYEYTGVLLGEKND